VLEPRGFRLGVFAMALGIESVLGDHQGLVARQILQAQQVGTQGCRIFQVDVVGNPVRVARDQILGAGIAGIGK
jgi:hypothetical protein